MPGVGRVLALPAGCLVAAALGGVVAGSAQASDRVLAVAVISVALFGLFELARGLRFLNQQRRRADDWLRTATGVFVPPAYAWRAAQLCSARRRRTLAKTLRLIVQAARERPIGNYRPPRLIAVRRRPAPLEVLAETLEHESQPVTPAGMLRVVELVTDGAGPLWGESGDALGDEIETTLAVLRAA